ncbi:MAG: GAF domain-containing protein [Anaerolineae bacterium]|nr:GAF domain-containing protein [Anaerolineae bacterium]
MATPNVLIFSEDQKIYHELAALLPKDLSAGHVATPEEWLAVDFAGVSFLVFVLPAGRELAVLETLKQAGDDLPVVGVLSTPPTAEVINTLLSVQLLAILFHPFDADLAKETLWQAIEREQRLARQRYLQENSVEINRRLNQRLQEINTIYTVGKFVAAALGVEEVLDRVVGASVNLTQADEGFILLKEDETLYLRASKSVQAEIVQSFHAEADDDVAWQVIRSGRPTLLQREARVATGLAAQALLYVPLSSPGSGTMGVLGVANADAERVFSENHLFTLSSVADFAAIALENARLFSAVVTERSRLSAILENATEAILVTDAQNRLLLWSDTAAKAFDIGPEALGQPVDTVMSHETIRALFQQSDTTQAMTHTEVTLGEGQIFNAQLTSIPELGRVAIMQDITRLKELDHLKSEFVSTVSHDLRTPLTTVQGYIELLARVGPLSDIQADFVKKALSSLTHITALIGDLLDIGRIEAGYDLEMVRFRLDELTRQTVEVYTAYAEIQGITLTADIPDTPLWIRGNARRIRQVIENLLSNAIKYNHPDGWIKVNLAPDDHHLVVEVTDNGIGIPLAEQPKLFERFYRVKSPETEDIAGTGLGLAIVKSVIERHKGRVWVESTPGKGSTFAFILPLSESEEVSE